LKKIYKSHTLTQKVEITYVIILKKEVLHAE